MELKISLLWSGTNILIYSLGRLSTYFLQNVVDTASVATACCLQLSATGMHPTLLVTDSSDKNLNIRDVADFLNFDLRVVFLLTTFWPAKICTLEPS